MIFEFFTSVKMPKLIFWAEKPCELVGGPRHKRLVDHSASVFSHTDINTHRTQDDFIWIYFNSLYSVRWNFDKSGTWHKSKVSFHLSRCTRKPTWRRPILSPTASHHSILIDSYLSLLRTMQWGTVALTTLQLSLSPSLSLLFLLIVLVSLFKSATSYTSFLLLVVYIFVIKNLKPKH
jgi:hypothetical protein